MNLLREYIKVLLLEIKEEQHGLTIAGEKYFYDMRSLMMTDRRREERFVRVASQLMKRQAGFFTQLGIPASKINNLEVAITNENYYGIGEALFGWCGIQDIIHQNLARYGKEFSSSTARYYPLNKKVMQKLFGDLREALVQANALVISY